MKKKGSRADAARARKPKRAPKRSGPFGQTSLMKVYTAIEDTERKLRRFRPAAEAKGHKDSALRFLEDLKARVRVACKPVPGRKAPIHWFGGVLGPED